MTTRAPQESLLSAGIREEARRLGFFRVGIARIRPLPDAQRFEAWLQAGMHGRMTYLERQAAKRLDPSLVLEAATSLVVVAMNYDAACDLTSEPLRGRISRYALGADYHVVVGLRLERLLGAIEGIAPGVRGISYVDTGPVLEKAWAAQSSLGWLGKNGNVIARERGSWFFLGVILLTCDLEYDEPEVDRCGTCTRCISACPTGAIVAPYVVDARLCISYLTIELRGPIPRRLRPLIGNRIFGCDDCQEVCPWNRFAHATGEEELLPQGGNLMPALAPLVELTTDEFNRRFRRSAVRRAKRDGFVRNVVVALGNSGLPEAEEPVARATQDPSALVRLHAAWALGRLGTPAARRALERSRMRERTSAVLEEIREALRLPPRER